MRIAVGLSGGVDSAVAAALLRDAGHAVIGVTMRIWDGRALPAAAGRGACYGPDEVHDVEDARRVATALGIPFHEIDLAAEYNARVLDPCVRAYRSGTTPNPCVHCNRSMKFELLVERLRASGIACDAFATGHYARVRRDEASGRYLLCRALDRDKDQSYFLCLLTQALLATAHFPLGELSKAQVRERARALNLPVAEKAESQDFVSGGYRAILGAAGEPGPLLDEDGKVLGRHAGIERYTIGQRRGLGVAAAEPLYVIAIETARNAVIVGPERRLYRDRLIAEAVNWIACDALTAPRRAQATIRYRHAGSPAQLTPIDGGRVRVEFADPQRAVTPGQAVVFYDDEVVLGGGIIASQTPA
jgi:tRNA-uridine 2-sulfurtransferase